MRLLLLHNQYGAISGEEHALRAIAGMLEENAHQVSWFLRSSAGIEGIRGKVRAFYSGIHSHGAAQALRLFLSEHPVDAALVQNLYPFLSPSILKVLREFAIPIIMRCPNYRLFCPNGLHLCHGEVCERCLGGKEYWCVIRNCEDDLFKSLGYALRNAAARISRRIVDHVDMFVVLSEFQRQRFIQGGIAPERLAVVPNVAPLSAKPSSSDPGVLVSFVGRISAEKGIEDFVAAAERLPEVPFALAGNYDQMPGLPDKSPKNVCWMGFLTGSALDEFYRRSRILVFPGRCFEGFPNVIASAMAAGKPVIASRLGAVREIVDHEKTGLLVEPRNVSELAGSIQRLYADPSECLRMGEAGRIKAGTCYSQEAVYRKLLEVFTRVIPPAPILPHRA
ncbi:glycosyltransferase family 4 protein [Desulfatiglans anilini]|uniref:glycosyltransferase family 4 protein n=1 Tax=Desulfatiglans anilini TaxID=90728 RepID=UPI00040F65F2|nr:glycosyltransferase family 4 protein [Desulfatiglans anilini]